MALKMSLFDKMKPLLFLGGEDPLNCAGLYLDSQIAKIYGHHPFSIMTEHIVQDHSSCLQTSPSPVFEKQLQLMANKKFHGIKIGVLRNPKQATLIANFLNSWLIKNFEGIIIIDPVLYSTASQETPLTQGESLQILLKKNIDYTHRFIITPNKSEFTFLQSILANFNELKVLVKDHLEDTLFRVQNGDFISRQKFSSSLIDKTVYKKIRGTGCLLSTLILIEYQKEQTLTKAIEHAKHLFAMHIQDIYPIETKLTYTLKPKQLLPQVTKGIYPITKFKVKQSIDEKIRSALKLAKYTIEHEYPLFQFRNKIDSTQNNLKILQKLQPLFSQSKTLFIINDRIDLALLSQADGVHLGKTDCEPKEAREILGSQKVIGLTINSLAELQKSIESNNIYSVNYIGLGPLNNTGNKNNLAPILNSNHLKNIFDLLKTNNINIPVFGIGGVNVQNISQYKTYPFHGFAIIGGLLNEQEKVNPEIFSKLKFSFQKHYLKENTL